tara:strand:- start:161 stop:343 length:183 start_codon:yes stop_codon:yes gene_type:complete
MKLQRYEFNLVVVGYGESVDEAFNEVLDSLKEDPEAAITNEVVYVVVNEEEQEETSETPT